MTININSKKVAIAALSVIVLTLLAFAGTQVWDWKKATEQKIADQTAQIVSLNNDVKTKTEAIEAKDKQITDLGGKVDTLAAGKTKAEKDATVAKNSAATANKNLTVAKQENENLTSWFYFLAELADNMDSQRANYRSVIYNMAVAGSALIDGDYVTANNAMATASRYSDQAKSYDSAIDNAINQLKAL
jgi:hypothetical protein